MSTASEHELLANAQSIANNLSLSKVERAVQLADLSYKVLNKRLDLGISLYGMTRIQENNLLLVEEMIRG